MEGFGKKNDSYELRRARKAFRALAALVIYGDAELRDLHGAYDDMEKIYQGLLDDAHETQQRQERWTEAGWLIAAALLSLLVFHGPF